MSSLREYIYEAVSHGYHRSGADISRIKVKMSPEEFEDVLKSCGYKETQVHAAWSYTVESHLDELSKDNKSEKRYIRYNLATQSMGPKPLFCRFVIFNGIQRNVNEYMVVDFHLRSNIVDDVVLYKRGDTLTTWVDSDTQELAEYIVKGK